MGWLLLAVIIAAAVIIEHRRDAERVARINRAYPFIPSPNYDWRPPFTTVNCVVLHATAEPTLPGTIGVFKRSANRVSAHFVVDRDGQVVQMVPVQDKAWHAGASELDGQFNVNDFSIGIEMVNIDDGLQTYPDAQYRAVAHIIKLLRTCYDIPDDRIVSHAQIARPPGRKPDPRGFDFGKLRRMLDK